ncbi:MAG: phytanoyl-CoA dioxygenase family protein [Alcanivorax sp.]|jgi:hypothetical protein|uniref:phytanoyl-CoA dioxygenase family protein n=1 Tax=Alcanivorax sp. TaxID=1872427 RepID=UPI0032D9258E
MIYTINGMDVFINVSGPIVVGNDLCLIDSDDNLSENCSWKELGFSVIKMLSREDLALLVEGISDLVLKGLIYAGCNVKSEEFALENYHLYCTDQDTHLKVVAFLKSMGSLHNLPISHTILDELISNHCGVLVSSQISSQVASGRFFVRLVRPFPLKDNNPPHKDVWLDRLRNAINLYLPLAGSDENSSLSLVPGSHLWQESEIPRTKVGAVVDGVKYSVPAAVIEDNVLDMIRPKVEPGEAMLFSPYLIHGGAVNFNEDKTRVSLEMRFWRCAE